MVYKDSLFRSIFNNEKSALALYSAVCGGSLGSASAANGESLSSKSAEVVMTTLNETLWTPRKNDLSFTVNGSLVVIAEHQSTINENMPYRMLQYVCRLFENGVADKKAVYRQALVKHPRPRFIVFFNGAAEFPDHKKMRLSDAFEPVEGFDGASLELEIDVYNVNEGRNRSILEACGELKGYAYFVSRARRHEKELAAPGSASDGLSRRDITLKAVRLAIRDCKDAGLLREFWEKLSQEEINMLANEWDMETALEVREEEGFERGVQRGRMEGLERGMERGMERGRMEGMERGMERGRETIALNALAEGLPMGVIQKITGLDTATITSLSQKAL